MTTRLLTRTGHAPGARTVADALSAASLTTFAQVNGSSVAGCALPLFRRGNGGTLDQIVRLAFTPRPADVERIELRRPDGTVAASWTGTLPRGGVLDLAVPEITAPATWAVTVTVAGAEHGGRLPVSPGRKLTVHLVHHSHLDIGYTDPRAWCSATTGSTSTPPSTSPVRVRAPMPRRGSGGRSSRRSPYVPG